MTTLFIDKRNLQLKVDSEALIFYDSNTAEKLGIVPIRDLCKIPQNPLNETFAIT